MKRSSHAGRKRISMGRSTRGDRITMVALMAVPLFLRHRNKVSNGLWRFGLTIIFISVVIQFSSVAFGCRLEAYQLATFNRSVFAVWLRMKNIVAFSLDKMSDWGLLNRTMTEDQWDYEHITAWNFLPFMLKRVGEARAGIMQLLTILWLLTLAMLGSLLSFAAGLMATGRLALANPPRNNLVD